MENMVGRPSLWCGRRVLVTGHTGFKGGWLSLWLQNLGAYVTGYSLPPPTDPSFFCKAHVGEGMNSLHGNIADLGAVESAFQTNRPELVFHLAAQPLVRLSYTDPAATYATNVMGTVNILEAARRTNSVRAVVVVTSDKCYENRNWIWGYRETEPMGGHDPYSSSKACAELVTAAYRRSFCGEHGAPQIASARAGNVIGGGDWAIDRLIPDFVRAIDRQDAVRIRSPDAIRPWQHVLDALEGYLCLAEHLLEHGSNFADAWNFGPADGDLTVADVVNRITALWGEGARWEPDERQHPHEAYALRLDCSKARALLRWRPRLTIDDALAWTVEWYKASQRGKDMHRFSLKQIIKFQQILAS